MIEEPTKYGNPWTILQLKNTKELIQIDLSDRDFDMLEKFEDFPYLEVVWSNNNKVKLNLLYECF